MPQSRRDNTNEACIAIAIAEMGNVRSRVAACGRVKPDVSVLSECVNYLSFANDVVCVRVYCVFPDSLDVSKYRNEIDKNPNRRLSRDQVQEIANVSRSRPRRAPPAPVRNGRTRFVGAVMRSPRK